MNRREILKIPAITVFEAAKQAVQSGPTKAPDMAELLSIIKISADNSMARDQAIMSLLNQVLNREFMAQYTLGYYGTLFELKE